MERLRKSAKTAEDVNRVLKESDLFRDVGLSGPVSLTEALRMDMSCLAETPATIGCPSTAWWWFVEVLITFQLIFYSFLFRCRISIDLSGDMIC